MALIVPDVLLHGLNVRFFRDVADVLCNKLLDVHDGSEGDGLLHHSHDLLIMDIPLGQQIGLVLLVGVIQLSPHPIGFQKSSQSRDIDGLSLTNEAVLRKGTVIEEETVLAAAVAAAVEHDAADKLLHLHIVQKLTGDEGGKVFPPPGSGVVFIHVCPQVSVQSPLGLLIGRLIEVAGVGLTQEHDLKSVDHSGLPRSVLTRQKIDVVHFDQLFREIQPVNQQDLLQLLHLRPPFLVSKRRHLTFRWRPQTKLSEG